MKHVGLVFALAALSACVSPGAQDADAAFDRCRSAPDQKFRDLCISRVLQEQSRARQDETEETETGAEAADQTEPTGESE